MVKIKYQCNISDDDFILLEKMGIFPNGIKKFVEKNIGQKVDEILKILDSENDSGVMSFLDTRSLKNAEIASGVFSEYLEWTKTGKFSAVNIHNFYHQLVKITGACIRRGGANKTRIYTVENHDDF